jgi:hypothetical protein
MPILVSCPENSMPFAALGSAAAEGCDEKGPATARCRRSVLGLRCWEEAKRDVLPSPPCRRPSLIATKDVLFRGKDTSAPSPRLVYYSSTAANFGRGRGARGYPQWSLIDEQQSTRPKAAQPSRLGRRRRLAARIAGSLSIRLAKRPCESPGFPTLLYEPRTWRTNTFRSSGPIHARLVNFYERCRQIFLDIPFRVMGAHL